MPLSINHNSIFLLICGMIVLVLPACGPDKPTEIEERAGRSVSAADSLIMTKAYEQQKFISGVVVADAETTPVASPNVDDDAADDVAIWYHAADPAKSLILVTNKKLGVAVYGFTGEEQEFYPVGMVNNIDVLQSYVHDGDTISLAGWTNGNDKSVDLYRISREGRLQDIAAGPLHVDAHAMSGVSGFCFYQGSMPYLFVGSRDGVVLQYSLVSVDGGKIDMRKERELRFDGETEGMVADAAHGVLYVAEEDRGIWKLHAEPEAPENRRLIELSDTQNPNIAYDIEGLTIYERGDYGYLIASCQGNYSYAVFDRTGNNRYLGSFKILESETIDGVEDTDGIDVISVSLGDIFPHGVFVAQDGFNFDGDTLARQNFKLVGWEKIQAVLEEKFR